MDFFYKKTIIEKLIKDVYDSDNFWLRTDYTMNSKYTFIKNLTKNKKLIFNLYHYKIDGEHILNIFIMNKNEYISILSIKGYEYNTLLYQLINAIKNRKKYNYEKIKL